MNERLVRIEELAFLLGVNQFTIERWYRFKRENPDNEYAKILPDPTYGMNNKNVKVRYWKADDIVKLQEFQSTIVSGTKGFMGCVTNLKKKKEKTNGKKKTNRSRRNKDKK